MRKAARQDGGDLFSGLARREVEEEGVHVYTVTEITREVKGLIEGRFEEVWVTGEVSNLRQPPSGHLYFTLKDEDAQLTAVMFRREAMRLRGDLEEGLRVTCEGRLSVYEPRGNYQIIVRRLEIKGAGALEVRFRQLVEKLRKEGLFEAERKREIPFLPGHIGIITSASGAAVIDMLRVFARRFPRVRATLFPTNVQGEAAAGQIVEAIEKANAFGGINVIILGRGGGSLEDLQPFNEEVVARAIAASKAPIVSGVGHEVDVTISDLVADARAATPTAAAEMVVPRESEVRDRLAQGRGRLARALSGRLETAQTHVTGLGRSVRPEVLLRQLEGREQRVDDLFTIARDRLGSRLALEGQALAGIHGKLTSLDPMGVLSRGYSVTTYRATGKILRDAGKVEAGQEIATRLWKGEVISEISSTKRGEER